MKRNNSSSNHLAATSIKQDGNYPVSNGRPDENSEISSSLHPRPVPDASMSRYQPFYKASGLPKDLTDMFGALHCKLCDVVVGSPMTAKAHYQGKSHTKKIKLYLTAWCENTGKPMPELPQIRRSETLEGKESCSFCDVTFNSVADAEIHFSGKNHMKRLRNSEPPLKKRKTIQPEDPTGRFGIGLSFVPNQAPLLQVPTTEKPQFVCNLCSVQATNEDQLKQHLNGAKHFKAVKAMHSSVVPAPARPADSILTSVCRGDETPRVSSDYSMHRTPTGNYYCQVCNSTMNSQEQFIQHVESKKHKAKIISRKPNNIIEKYVDM